MANSVYSLLGDSATSASTRFRLALTTLAGVAVIAIHIYLSAQPSTFTSPLAFFDRLFDMGLVAALALLGVGIGRIVLRRIGWQSDSPLEASVFAFGVGSGLLSLGLLLVGLARLLFAPVVLGIFIVGTVATNAEWRQAIKDLRESWVQRVPFSRTERLLLAAIIAIALPVLISAMMPPTDVDALGYHLVAPTLFLKNHAVIPAFDNVGVNYPIGVDMLYLFGLAAGSDISAQLVHFSFALTLALGIYAFASRYLSRMVGLLALLVFWTSPVIGLEASAPILDLGWAFFEYTALYAFFRWRESCHWQDLVVAGAAIGFALSSKYLAAIGFLVLGALVIVESVRTSSYRWSWIAKHAVLFGSAAAIVAVPWYLKNALWLGNPVYPFFSGNYGFDGSVHQGNGDLSGWVSMGLGHDVRALLLFPWNVYVNWQYFGSPVNRGGPSLLFLLLPLYFLMPKRRIVTWLFLICGVRFSVWWSYAQNIRYLAVIFPWLSLASAYTTCALAAQVRRPSLQFGLVLVLSIFVLVGIFFQWGFVLILREGVFPFLAGQVSRDAYLTANLLDYPATRFMNEQLPADARVFAIGDARVYYLQRSIIPDEAHSNWLDLTALEPTSDGVAMRLRTLGVTHVWISEDELLYFRRMWQIAGPAEAQAHIFDEFRKQHLDQVYADERGHAVYKLRE